MFCRGIKMSNNCIGAGVGQGGEKSHTVGVSEERQTGQM